MEGFSCHEKSESEESIQFIQIPSPKSFLVQLNKNFLGETEQEQEEFSSTYGDAGQLLIDSVHGAKKKSKQKWLTNISVFLTKHATFAERTGLLKE